jgi:GMP synthase-like glutamine amidotransferase
MCLLGVLIALIGLTVYRKISPNEKLIGLLIDLEIKGPQQNRFPELREALTARLLDESDVILGVDIELRYVHFSQLTTFKISENELDFVILSPQSTPWHIYGRDAPQALETAKNQVRRLVESYRIPLLGVCGGHQFLAMAFGGSVSFIDPKDVGTCPERYTSGMLSEKGIVVLDTIRDDPILEGISTHPGQFLVMENHCEEVKKLPQPFVNLAGSRMSEFQLMRFPGKKVYGTAFHPERGWQTPPDDKGRSMAGRRLLINFFLMARDEKRSRLRRN